MEELAVFNKFSALLTDTKGRAGLARPFLCALWLRPAVQNLIQGAEHNLGLD